MVAGVLLLTALAVYLLFRLRNLLFMVFVAAFIAVAIEPAVHSWRSVVGGGGWRPGWSSSWRSFSAWPSSPCWFRSSSTRSTT